MGARTDQKCSICKADENVRAAVESLLQNKTKLDDVARESGFSRAALSRHSRKHMLRHALNRHREMKMNLDGCRIVTQLPTARAGFFTLHTVETNSRGRTVVRYLRAEELKPDDVLQVVSYEKPLTREESPDTPQN
jgi:hypothetical protein